MDTDTSRGGIATPESPRNEPAASRPPEAAEAPARPMPAPQPPYAGGPQAPHPPYPSYPPYQYPPYPYPPRRQRNGWVGWLVGGIVVMLLLGGLVVVLIFGLLGWAALGTTRYTDTTTRTFAVTGAPSVNLRDTAGNVTFQRGGDGQVTVQITKIVRTANSSVAQRELNALNVTTTQSGNAITVEASFGTNFFDGAPSSRTVDLVVTLPANATITGHLNAGNLTASGIAGALKLDTDAGNVTATDVVLADGSGLSTNAGNVTADAQVLQGATVDMSTNAGNVTATLPVNTPAKLEARVNVGNLTVSGWPISVTGQGPGHSASGDLGSPATGLVRMTSNAGNVTVTAR